MTGIQMTTAALYFVILVGLCLWMQMNKRRWLYAVPILLWVLHTLLFYLAVQFRDIVLPFINQPDFVFWSSTLRLQGALTILGILVFWLAVQYRGPVKGNGSWISRE